LNGLSEVGDRTVVLTLGTAGEASVVVGVGIFRIARDQSAARRHCFVAVRPPASLVVVRAGERGGGTKDHQRGYRP
jgi:hypothetical protein